MRMVILSLVLFAAAGFYAANSHDPIEMGTAVFLFGLGIVGVGLAVTAMINTRPKPNPPQMNPEIKITNTVNASDFIGSKQGEKAIFDAINCNKHKFNNCMNLYDGLHCGFTQLMEEPPATILYVTSEEEMHRLGASLAPDFEVRLVQTMYPWGDEK